MSSPSYPAVPRIRETLERREGKNRRWKDVANEREACEHLKIKGDATSVDLSCYPLSASAGPPHWMHEISLLVLLIKKKNPFGVVYVPE